MPLQVPNLDDRTFDELVREAVVRIPVHTPEWNNFNDSDPGMTFVQLFAFMTENLLYRSNRIPEANRKKFLTLLGVGLLPKTPGRGLVIFNNERGPLQPVAFPEGGELRAGNVPFRTLRRVNILPVTAAAYYKAEQTDLDPALRSQYEQLYESFRDSPSGRFQFYQTMPLEPPAVGQELPELDLADPQQAIDQSVWLALLAPKNVDLTTVRAALARQSLSIGVYPSLYSEGKRLEPKAAEPEPVADPGLIFEIAAPDPAATETPKPARYKRLEIEYAESVLERPGIVTVTLPRAEEMIGWEFDPTEEGTGDYPPRLEDRELAQRVVTWLRVRLANREQTDTYHPARLSWIGVNATQVIQAVAIRNELLGVANGAPGQTYQVANTPVIIEEKPTSDGRMDENVVLEVEEPASDGSTTWQRWTRTDDIYAADQEDIVFMLDPEAGTIRFGDGLRGKRPAQGRRIRISYEYGGGPEGKLSVGQINKSALLPGGFKVENPVPTWGASRGETTVEGERNIAGYIRHRDRLVTAQDFEDITRRTPGLEIGRVEVLPLFHPDKFEVSNPSVQFPGVVTIMVIPDQPLEAPDPPVPDRLFLDTVCRWLDTRRLVTTELYVRGPEYVPVYVTIGVETMPGQVRSLVYKAVREALREYLSPLVGGISTPGETASEATERGWPLGMEVRRQDLEAVAVRVEGVRYVTGVRLGVYNAVGNLVDVPKQLMLGLQLPWLSGIDVGAQPEALDVFTGAPVVSDALPVPVIPKKC